MLARRAHFPVPAPHWSRLSILTGGYSPGGEADINNSKKVSEGWCEVSVAEAVLVAASPGIAAASRGDERCESCGELRAHACSVCDGNGHRVPHALAHADPEPCIGCNGQGRVYDLHVCWPFK